MPQSERETVVWEVSVKPLCAEVPETKNINVSKGWVTVLWKSGNFQFFIFKTMEGGANWVVVLWQGTWKEFKELSDIIITKLLPFHVFIHGFSALLSLQIKKERKKRWFYTLSSNKYYLCIYS